MKKQHIRLTAALLLMVLLLGLLPVAQAAESVSASGNSIDLSLDGKAVKIGAYNIAGSNYIKLRDIVQLLKGTDQEFAVAWDGVPEHLPEQLGGVHSRRRGAGPRRPRCPDRPAQRRVGALVRHASTSDGLHH